MSKYTSESESSFGWDIGSLGWSLLVVVLLVSGSFLLGVYYGYNRGYRTAKQSVETRSDQLPQSKQGNNPPPQASSADTNQFETVITKSDLKNKPGRAGDDEKNQSNTGQETANRSGATEDFGTPSPDESEVTSSPESPVQPDQQTASGPGQTTESGATAKQPPSYREEGDAASRSEPGYTLQVSSFLKQDHARPYRDKLREAGYEATITQKTRGETVWYRVRVGHFTTREQAEKQGRTMKSKGLIENYYSSKLTP